jgi:hypothetical protein
MSAGTGGQQQQQQQQQPSSGAKFLIFAHHR